MTNPIPVLPGLVPDVAAEPYLFSVAASATHFDLRGSEAWLQPDVGLRASVETYGVLVPLVVVAADDSWLDSADQPALPLKVLDGRRRLLAALECQDGAQPLNIPVAVFPRVCRDEAFTLVANDHRTSNPVAEYQAIKRLLADGFSLPEIATATGLSRATMGERLRFDALIEPLQVLLLAGRLRPALARGLRALPPAEQEALLPLAEAGELRASHIADRKKVLASGVVDQALAGLDTATGPVASSRNVVQALNELRLVGESLADVSERVLVLEALAAVETALAELGVADAP